jgi:hypothetical protein
MFHGDLPATTQMSFLHLLSSIFGSANLVVAGLNNGLDFIGNITLGICRLVFVE